jgi:membrane-associated phospholipid phosphatase
MGAKMQFRPASDQRPLARGEGATARGRDLLERAIGVSRRAAERPYAATLALLGANLVLILACIGSGELVFGDPAEFFRELMPGTWLSVAQIAFIAVIALAIHRELFGASRVRLDNLWSFPSAHSASAVALYVMLAVIATTLWRRQLRPAVAFAVAGAVVALVGLSRIYLGAHYPTDVLAGWLTGGILVVASWAACSRLPSVSTARPAA